MYQPNQGIYNELNNFQLPVYNYHLRGMHNLNEINNKFIEIINLIKEHQSNTWNKLVRFL